MCDFTEPNFLILISLWLIDLHLSFEDRQHTFYSVDRQIRKLFSLTHPVKIWKPPLQAFALCFEDPSSLDNGSTHKLQ